jgi:hypothetical protein
MLISVCLGRDEPTNNGSYLSCLPPKHQPSGPSVRPDTCWSSPASSVLVKASSPETVSRRHKRSLYKVNTIWCTTELQNHTNICSKLNTASCKLRPFWTRHRPRLERLYMSWLWSPPQNSWLLPEISFLRFIRAFCTYWTLQSVRTLLNDSVSTAERI